MFIQVHQGVVVVCFHASLGGAAVSPGGLTESYNDLLTLTETLLVLSICSDANLLHPAGLLLLGAAAAAVRKTLEALALHAVPHAVAEVDQEALERCRNGERHQKTQVKFSVNFCHLY